MANLGTSTKSTIVFYDSNVNTNDGEARNVLLKKKETQKSTKAEELFTSHHPLTL